MDEVEKLARVRSVAAHQPRQRGAVLVEVAFLDPPRLGAVAADQPPDEFPHADVDEREEVGRGGVKAVVEIEDPAIDVAERGQHPAPVGQSRPFSKMKASLKHKLLTNNQKSVWMRVVA